MNGPIRQSPWKPAAERRNDRQLKRDAVLLAAAQAYNEQGYHNTSLDEIARRLGVTKPTVYHYFKNKEELLYECFRTGLRMMNAAFESVGPGATTGRDKLTAVIRKYIEVLTLEYGRILVRVSDYELSRPMSNRIKKMKATVDHRIRDLIQEGIDDGSIRPCDPKMTTFAIAGAVNGVAEWYRPGVGLNPDQIADHYVATFMHGIASTRRR